MCNCCLTDGTEPFTTSNSTTTLIVTDISTCERLEMPFIIAILTWAIFLLLLIVATVGWMWTCKIAIKRGRIIKMKGELIHAILHDACRFSDPRLIIAL